MKRNHRHLFEGMHFEDMSEPEPDPRSRRLERTLDVLIIIFAGLVAIKLYFMASQ